MMELVVGGMMVSSQGTKELGTCVGLVGDGVGSMLLGEILSDLSGKLLK